MARQARKKSESGIYHIMVRGINHQDIFCDHEDNIRFLDSIQRVQQSRCIIYGYCLMGNHVNLLPQEHQEDIAVTMKRLCTGYARWYNCKYERSCHLFQNRYKSEPVEDDTYFLTVICYIHNNPVKATLVKTPEEWEWSSCKAYYEVKENSQEMTETTKVLSLFSNDTSEAILLFKQMPKAERNEILRSVKQMEGITCRQIGRVLGISPSLILKL